MKLQREWVTPVTMGAFGLLAVTGILMFFHADSGMNKVVHEWLSWLLLAGVAGHAFVNLPGLKRHLAGTTGRAVLGASALVLALSFLPLGGEDGPPFIAPIRALADAPLPLLAQVAKTTPAEIRGRLERQGLKVDSDAATVHTLVGDDVRRQVHVLGAVMGSSGG
jgi:hypothetical protein